MINNLLYASDFTYDDDVIHGLQDVLVDDDVDEVKEDEIEAGHCLASIMFPMTDLRVSWSQCGWLAGGWISWRLGGSWPWLSLASSLASSWVMRATVWSSTAAS